MDMIIKNVELNAMIVSAVLNYTNVKDDLIVYKWFNRWLIDD